MNTEKFIKRAKEVHGDKYDYSKVEYVNNRTKVCIICPKHGEFFQTPANHLSGKGCPNCSNNVRLTIDEFIKKSKAIHGDKYDYSKVEYVNANTKVCIICPEHGEFRQTPGSHLNGCGCKKCANDGLSSDRKLSLEEFIKKAQEVHGTKYDYSKVKYVNSVTKVCIICPKHGEFRQTPGSHLSGCGCRKCIGNYNLTKEEFIKKAQEVHGTKYDYSKVKYVNGSTKVCIICPKHGEFLQTPIHHLRGDGCNKCAIENRTALKRMSLEEFVNRAKVVHGNKYDYSKVEYTNCDTNVCIICPKHGEFWQTPYKHLSGNGCPTCNNGYSKDNKLKLLTEYDLENMSYHQLMELISTNALPWDFKKLVYSESGSEKRKDTIKELKKLYEDTTLAEEDIEKRIETEIGEEEKKYEKEHKDAPVNGDKKYVEEESKEPEDKLPNTENADKKLITELNVYDRFGKQLVSYGDKNKFLVEVEIQKIWNLVLTEDNRNSTTFLKELHEQRKTSSEWLSYVIDKFFDEFAKVKKIKVDKDYQFKYKPNLMQKLMVYKMFENNVYLNLCGTGAGKTNAFLISTKAVGANRCVIICPNSVVDTWEKSIKAIYPNSNILKYQSNYDLKYITEDNLYVIVNYDKFSSGQLATKYKMDKFIDAIKPQFLCFDEIHNAKARNEDASKRHDNLIYFRQHTNEVCKEGLKVLGMTATPLINNLNEVKSLIELVSGKEFNEIGNRNTIENIHLAYKNLLLYGFRYVPDYSINVINTEVKVDGDEKLKDSLINLKNSDINIIEGNFVDVKMNSVKDYLTPSTIIYSTFIEKIVPKIEKKLKEFGITYAKYTGQETAEERITILENFANKKFDILIASSPITTGVDGLQKFCNKMILISLPWTNAEYTQLIGRINRQGSVFNEVNIIFPHVDIKLDNGNTWSWDKYRKNIILKKKTLSDAVVDGIFSYTANISKSKLLQGAIEALRNGEATTDFELNRNDVVPTPSTEETTREYSDSIVNNMHRKANTSRSKTMHKFFKDNPDEWRKYHDARDIGRAEWTEDPQDVIASKINELSGYGVIADLGCGRNELKNKVTALYRKWLSFDHIANDDSVIEADTTDLSAYVDDDSLDVAVYCLSLWGTNTEDYFKEASRMLKKNGTMYVVEPKDVIVGALTGIAAKYGLEIKELVLDKAKFNYITFFKM